MVKEHLKHPNISMIYSSFYLCSANLEIIKKSEYPIQIPKDSTYLEQPCGRISHFATFKMNLYNQTQQINPTYKRAVDQDLYYKLEEVGELFINLPLYYYRNHEKGISLHSNKNKAYAWSLVARIDACKRRNISIEEILPKVIESETSIRSFYENSSDYKLGKILLKPIRIIKSMLGFYSK